MSSADVARALKQSLHRTQFQIRTGLIPAVKMPGGHRWRVRRDVIEAILEGRSTTPTPARPPQASPPAQFTPAQRRAELLGNDTIELAELAADAGPLTEAQKDAIRSAFQGGSA